MYMFIKNRKRKPLIFRYARSVEMCIRCTVIERVEFDVINVGWFFDDNCEILSCNRVPIYI